MVDIYNKENVMKKVYLIDIDGTVCEDIKK